MTKNVPLEDIVGTHSDLLSVDDSIKVMLSSTDGKYWSVKAMIPMSNTKSWSDVPGTDENASEHFIAAMGNLDVVYYDENGSELTYDVKPDWSAVKSLLQSEDIRLSKFRPKRAGEAASRTRMRKKYSTKSLQSA